MYMDCTELSNGILSSFEFSKTGIEPNLNLYISVTNQMFFTVAI